MGSPGSPALLGGHSKVFPYIWESKMFLERKEPPQKKKRIWVKSIWLKLGPQILCVNTHLPRAWGNMVLGRHWTPWPLFSYPFCRRMTRDQTSQSCAVPTCSSQVPNLLLAFMLSLLLGLSSVHASSRWDHSFARWGDLQASCGVWSVNVILYILTPCSMMRDS